MKKKPTLTMLDSVLASAEELSRRTVAVWEDRVAPEHIQELRDIKAAWRAGQIAGPTSRVAKLISEEMAVRGIAIVGGQGVISWLKRN